MKKPTICATWALLAAVAGPVPAAEPAPQPYRLAAPPAWISPARDIPMDTSKPVEEGDSDYLLVEHQLKLATPTEHYQRFVERMVSQEAIEDSAQISIDLDPVHERVLLHDVHVIRNGRTIDKLGDARRSLLNREADLEDGIINGRVTLHVLLQDVRVGDVLDYSYTRERNDPFGERGYNGIFTTQWGSPVRRFRLRILQRADQPLQIRDHSKLAKPVVERKGPWIETTWSGRDIVGLHGDDHRPPWFFFLPRVEISEFAGWNAVRAWSQPMYVLEPKQSAAFKALVAELKSEPDDAARIVRALRFVQDDIRYTGLEIGAGAYRPSQPATVLTRRYGDCKDKVLLLTALLRALGVEAHPALVSSRFVRGVADRIPGPGAFDHVIAKVRWKDSDYWLDATVSGQGGGLDALVQADFGLALVLDGSSGGLEALPARQGIRPGEFVTETFDLRNGREKSAGFTVKTEYREEDADNMRVKMRNTTVTAMGKDYLDYYRKSYAGVRMTRPLVVKDDRAGNVFTVEESYVIDKPFRKDKKGKWKFHLEAYLVSERSKEPRQTERTTPLARAFPMHVQHQIVVHLNDQWDIEEDVVKISDPAFEYRSTVKFAKGRLQLDYDLRNTKDHVTAEAFERFAGTLSKVNDDAYYTLTDEEGGAAPDKRKTYEITIASAPTGKNLLAIVMVLVGVMAGTAAALALTRLRRRPAEPWPDAPVGLDGWMTLPAIAVLLLPFVLLNSIRIWFDRMGTQEQFQRIADSAQVWQLTELLLLSVLTVPSVIAAWLMIKRHSAFPVAFIATQSMLVLALAVDFIAKWNAGGMMLAPASEFAAHAVVVLFWVLGAGYMLTSQRVRATFATS